MLFLTELGPTFYLPPYAVPNLQGSRDYCQFRRKLCLLEQFLLDYLSFAT